MQIREVTLKPVIPTLAYYAVGISIVFILNKISPSGPCTPGLGALAFLLFILVSAILVIRNICLAIKDNRKYLVAVITHVVVLSILFIISSYV